MTWNISSLFNIEICRREQRFGSENILIHTVRKFYFLIIQYIHHEQLHLAFQPSVDISINHEKQTAKSESVSSRKYNARRHCPSSGYGKSHARGYNNRSGCSCGKWDTAVKFGEDGPFPRICTEDAPHLPMRRHGKPHRGFLRLCLLCRCPFLPDRVSVMKLQKRGVVRISDTTFLRSRHTGRRNMLRTGTAYQSRQYQR